MRKQFYIIILRIYSHPLFLSSASPYFASMLPISIRWSLLETVAAPPYIKGAFCSPSLLSSPLPSPSLSLSLSPAVISIPSVFFVFILCPPHRFQGQPRPATGWFADLGERNRLPVVQGTLSSSLFRRHSMSFLFCVLGRK